MLIRTSVAIAAIAFGASAVVAQSDAIATRKALMKEVGGQSRAGAAMVKGEAPFDAAKAQAIFAKFIEASSKMPSLFPDNSKSGGETTAAPKIWEDMAGFKSRFEKLGAEAKAAGAAVKDLDSFKASFSSVTKNCGGCHEVYRIKKS